MSENDKSINLKLSDYQQKGLYLILKDSTRLVLTKENIEKVTVQYWENPDKIPSKVKKAIEFQRCPFCPLKGKGDFCDALRPILPFLDIVDKYVSFDKVMAVYKSDEEGLYYVADTTMQEALKYVSTLSLTNYCQIGKRYEKYYFGIAPIVDPKNMAVKLYLNIYWFHKGNVEKINEIVKKFNEELRITSGNQVKRLNLICKNDAFMNAFVNTHIATEFLTMDIDKFLEKTFHDFGEDAANSGYIPAAILEPEDEEKW